MMSRRRRSSSERPEIGSSAFFADRPEQPGFHQPLKIPRGGLLADGILADVFESGSVSGVTNLKSGRSVEQHGHYPVGKAGEADQILDADPQPLGLRMRRSTPPRARTRLCRHRAMRPFPSRNGWVRARRVSWPTSNGSAPTATAAASSRFASNPSMLLDPWMARAIESRLCCGQLLNGYPSCRRHPAGRTSACVTMRVARAM
jgi:hypothetical protein